MSCLRPTVVTILALLFAPLMLAQFPSAVNNDTRTPVPGSGHDYINMLTETVDPSNGSLSVHISTPVPPSRGITIPFSFDYSSGAVQQAQGSNGLGSWAPPIIFGGVLDALGWSYRIPELSAVQTKFICYINGGGGRTLTTYVWLSYIFTDPSGLRHNLGLANTETPNPDCVYPVEPYNVLSGADDFYSATISGANGFTGGTVTVVGVDGTVYNFPNTGWQSGLGVNTLLPSTIEDRNGNIVTISQGSGGKITETDTSGRLAVSISAPVGTNGTVGVSGLSNPYTITWETMNPSYGSQYEQLGESYPNCDWLGQGANEGSNGVIKSIELPNGEYYTFGYGSYGLLNQITYPTGAVVNYTWTTPSSPNGEIEFPDNGNNQSGCLYAYYAPMVTQRTVKFDGVHTALVQNFSYTTAYNTGVQQATVQTTVYSSNGSTNLGTFKTVYNYAAFLPYIADPEDLTVFPTPMPVEQTVQYYDYGQTNLLETVTKAWQDQFRLGCQLETHDGSGLSGTFYSYGPGLSLTSEEEYDYGQISSTSQCPQAAEGGTITAPTTAPTRETVTTYYDSFANAPATVKIYLNGASGTLESETDYSYDQSSTSSASAINHDGTNYGPSSTIPRANATTVVRKCLQSAPACSSGNPTTTYSYDETGQVTSMKDPNGNTTQYSHADSYTSGTPPGQTNAYLTKETNALGYFTSFAYSYSDGQLTRYTDLNTQITNYTYNTPPSGCTFPDGWDRLSQVKYPDGGTTSYCYNDAAYNPSTPSPSVTTTKKINSASNYVSTAAFDGTGHTVSTILSSDPSGTDYVDTTYDGLGHVYTVTNPFRTTSDPTYATNTYTYDALGRVTKINYFGGSASSFNDSYTYSGRAVQSVHLVNAGNFTKVSQSDALGRLTSVCEVTGAAQMGSQNPAACGQDIAATGFLTSYIYDALGDLLTVNNAVNFGQARSFTYDSLSRLTSSQNPELFENVVTYTYDALGDLAQKVAPAPNQTGSATVTTTYSYDALERPTGVSYSDGKTPTSNFEYDQSSIFGVTLTNPIGRLTSRWISGGANTGGGQEENLGYDPMGRIAFSMQCTPETCGWAAFGFNYAYDLLGDLLTSSNGNGITWTNTYNAAAQLQQTATNVLTPTTSGDLISGILYNALGKPTSSLLGNTLAESWGYDGSGGVTSYSMGSVYNFSAVNDLGGLIWAANDSVNGNWTYTYDGFERLSTSTQAGGAAFGYAYDSVGNRWQQNVTAGSGPAPQYTFGPYNHVNSGNGIAYDSAGNETGDGIHNYTYDAENRLIQVDTPGTGYTYVYDTVGRRVGKYNDQISNEYLYDLQNHAVTNLVAAAASSAGVICSNCGTLNTQSSDIYLGGRHLGLYYNNTTYFTAQNWLGTLRARTGIDGNVLETCTSLPFGDSQNCVSSDGEPGSVDRVHFTGKERDAESGLDNFGFRYYGSSLGRFMSADDGTDQVADNPQSWNLYSYVRNNPLRYTDPDGHDCIHINTDTGKFEGFDSGDCDNSTEEKANSGIYVDGTINTLQFNSSAGSLDFGYTDANGNVGAGTILGVAQPGPAAPINDPGMIPGMLGPGDLILFSGVKLPSVVTDAVGKLVGSILGKGAQQGAEQTVELTTHAATRLGQRGITQAAVDQAVQTAKAAGQVTTQMGKYGTEQLVYKGTNGITVVVETQGSNAGKAITVFQTGSKP